MGKNISNIISDICRKNGIDYLSPNPELNPHYVDAKRLKEIYLQLKCISADLIEIGERYNLESFKTILEDDINKIDNCSHDLVILAKKIK